MRMNPYEQYKQQDLETSNQQEIVGKLYNEGAMSLKRAIIALADKKYDVVNENIKKAQTIVSTLNKCLDMQYEIAGQLRSLYLYMLRRLIEANVKKDKIILEEISGMFSDLRDVWSEAITRSKKLQSI
jgi:flagellar protein FliS